MNKDFKLFYPIIGSLLLIFVDSYQCEDILNSFFNIVHLSEKISIPIIIIVKAISFLGILSLIFFSILLIKQTFKNFNN